MTDINECETQQSHRDWCVESLTEHIYNDCQNDIDDQPWYSTDYQPSSQWICSCIDKLKAGEIRSKLGDDLHELGTYDLICVVNAVKDNIDEIWNDGRNGHCRD